MKRFTAALARAFIHGKNREIWALTETVGHLITKRRELEARLAEVEAKWAEDRRTIARLKSLTNLARDLDAGVEVPDGVPEEWAS